MLPSGELSSSVGPSLLCRCDNVQGLVVLLSPVVLDKKCMARIEITSQGLTIITELSRTLQAITKVDKGLFAEWTVGPNEQFVVAISTLLDCLQVFGKHSIGASVRIAWRGYGEDLMVVVHEGTMRTECSLRTYEPDDPLDLQFRLGAQPTKLTINADSLHDAFAELDASAAYVSISVDARHFRLTTVGSSGASSQVEYANDSTMFDLFESAEPQQFHYKLSSLQPCVKALNGASKCQLRINDNGVLSMQHLIKASDGTSSIVDFFMVASEVDEIDGDMDMGE